MAGNKNSGRGTATDNKLRTAVINKSWEIVDKMFNQAGIATEKKQTVALEICKRSIPQQVKHSGDEDNPIVSKSITELKGLEAINGYINNQLGK